EVFREMKKLGKQGYARFNAFQDNIALGQANDWRCRAGSRYLYVCENGLVHYCSQQRGYPGIPLAEYSVNDLRREYRTKKSCAPNCTISCVHQTSIVDFWRSPQSQPSHQVFRPAGQAELVKIESRREESVMAD
ncbi:MAG TPA: radical SAM protein, partial [Alphaproteobacteria bacterium]|nr:radical SAM protein [Alphaproteobacteria bacterium]